MQATVAFEERPALKREQKLAPLTLAHPFRWRLRNAGIAEFARAFDLQKAHDCARIRISAMSRVSEEVKVRSN